ncbi:MAG: hypothetical protein ACI4OU_01785 [Candidatus Enterenecus sp.]
MPDTVTATITKEITKGYAEAILWENGAPGEERCIVRNPERARRHDVVELTPVSPEERSRRDMLPYLVVPLFFVIGMLLERYGTLGQRLLSGAILALLGFLLMWLTTRRTRMRQVMSYEVVQILEKAPDAWTHR